MPAPSDEPNPTEKCNAMERILASDSFRRTVKPMALLRFIVENDLAGKPPLEEYTLGLRVFERRENWITQEDAIVRENMRRLRALLKNYYATEGREDWLALEFIGYRSQFTYNPDSPFEQHYRRALRYLASDPSSAFALLNAALNIQGNHAGALAAWSEAELWRPLFGYDLMLPQILESAEGYCNKALECDERHWRAHIVEGALYCCRRKWRQAAEAFEAALRDSPADVEAHPWYAAFLMAIDHTEQALTLVRAHAHESPSDAWALAIYALFLYVAREFDAARSTLIRALRIDPDHWLGDVLWACVWIARAERRMPVPATGMANAPRFAEGIPAFPVLKIPSDLQELPVDHPDYELIRGAMEDVARRKLALWTPPDDEAHYRAIGEPYITPAQAAIGYMAMGENACALSLLRRDADRHHPLLAWLHLWPIFDPLRKETDFQTLIHDIEPPAL